MGSVSRSEGRVYLTSLAASCTACSMSFVLTSSSLATCFSAFSPALSSAAFSVVSPTMTSAASPVVDELAELLDVGTRHALPQVAADAADGGADDGASR